MREILFRGQTRRKGDKLNMNGEPVEGNWVYGGVFQGEGDFSVIYQKEPTITKFSVYTDTIGQFTGLCDKAGRKIFEGDICKLNIIGSGDENYVVIWHECSFKFKSTQTTRDPYDYSIHDEKPHKCEVIGNIHDNPELLEVSE